MGFAECFFRFLVFFKPLQERKGKGERRRRIEGLSDICGYTLSMPSTFNINLEKMFIQLVLDSMV